MRSAPIWVGITTRLAPACSSLPSVEGSSPRAMISMLGIEAARRQGDEDIGGVVGQHAGQDAGPRDAGFRKAAFIGGVAHQAEIAQFAHLGGALFILLDHHEFGAAGLQLLGQHEADAAEADHDHMVFQFVDFRFHALDPEYLLQLGDGEKLHQGAGQQDHAGAAQDHGAHGHGMQDMAC